jgi:hypothetical protein
LRMMSAPITPGTHAQRVSKKTITIEPQPLSKTASGGNRIASRTLNKLMVLQRYKFVISK